MGMILLITKRALDLKMKPLRNYWMKNEMCEYAQKAKQKETEIDRKSLAYILDRVFKMK